MDCTRFKDALPDLASAVRLEGEAAEHVDACAACAWRLLRARAIAEGIAARPRERPPAGLREGLFRTAFPRRRLAVSAFVRSAAAMVLGVVLGWGAATALRHGGSEPAQVRASYVPLDVRIVEVEGDRAVANAFALDETYGPDAVLLLADGVAVVEGEAGIYGGGAKNRDGR